MNCVIVGHGFVGKATGAYLDKFNIDVDVHDPAVGLEADRNKEYDFVFYCLPTNEINGKLDISILEQEYGTWKGEQVIRSTIGPDQVDKFNEPTMWPEFLREITWKDQLSQPEVENVIGKSGSSFFCFWLKGEAKVTEVTAKEAAMFKMSRNAFLSMKVTFANILNDNCKKNNINYYTVKELLKRNIDPTTHLDVPGPDGKFGFGGKCLPKDTTHYQTLSNDTLFMAVLGCNEIARKMK